MKIVFMGSADFSVPTFKALIESKHNVIAAVCQPDKPKGRGGKLSACPVKEIAIKNNIEIFQPVKLRRDGLEKIKEFNPDIIVTAAYGQIISQEIIDVPKFGIVNVHASLLPAWRGAAPINWAIISGNKQTGVTIMQTNSGIDTGDILTSVKTKIGEYETAGELSTRLSIIGAEALLKTLDKIESGNIVKTKQGESTTAYAKMLDNEICKIDFNKTAEEIRNLVRALSPIPTAYFCYKNSNYKVFETQNLTENDLKMLNIEANNAKNGEILAAKSKIGLIIKCQSGATKILKIQAAGGKPMSIKDFLNGKSFTVGDILC